MKKIILTTLFIAGCTILALCSENNFEYRETTKARVEIADLPKSINFAGEKVPINFPYIREAIDREVLTTSCMHTSTMLMLRNVSRYFPVIEPILKKNGVPDDFKYLCMAESGLNPNAQSYAKAAGLWQFISSAAKEYGLETGDNTDLRYHVEESTEAACKYLKKAYVKFGSWTLAAASYNAGQAGISRRMETQGVSDYWDLFLPEETMRYVPRIISMKLLVADPEKYGFHLNEDNKFKPYSNYKVITINDRVIDWSKVAAKYGTNYRQLRILNPWIRSYTYNNGVGTSYEVKIPLSNFKTLGY